MRIFSLLFGALVVVGELQAHDVVWWEDPFGFTPGDAMDFYYPSEVYDFIGVVPSQGEPCTVVVNLDPPTSMLISAQVLPPNPANAVGILVTILRKPSGLSEQASATGEWHATGLPPDKDCNAVTPNKFTVPIVVLNRGLLWHLMPAGNGKWLTIDAGINYALQSADSLAGPWLNVGQGQTFTVNTENSSGFFTRLKKVGGIVSGSVTDPSGNALSGVKLGLLYGGPTATTDTTGALSRSPARARHSTYQKEQTVKVPSWPVRPSGAASWKL